MRLERIPWESPEEPTESALSARLAADGFASFAWTDPPDADYSAHSHDHDESLWVIEGEITFGAEGKELRLGPGDRLTVPLGSMRRSPGGTLPDRGAALLASPLEAGQLVGDLEPGRLRAHPDVEQRTRPGVVVERAEPDADEVRMGRPPGQDRRAAARAGGAELPGRGPVVRDEVPT